MKRREIAELPSIFPGERHRFAALHYHESRETTPVVVRRMPAMEKGALWLRRKTAGDTLVEAIQDAIDKQDFSALQTNVERSLSEVADAIGDITHQVQSQAQRTQRDWLRKRAKGTCRAKEIDHEGSRYGSAAGQPAAGVAMIVVGTGALGFFGLSLLGTAVIFEAPIALGLLAMMCVAAGAIIALGIGRVTFANRFKTYRDIISTRTFCYLEEIARRTHAGTAAVRKNAKRMIKRGLFKQAALDDGEEFVVSVIAGLRRIPRGAQKQESERERDFSFARRKRARRSARRNEARRAMSFPGESGFFIAQIRKSNEEIDDAVISEKLDRIEHVVGSILERVAEHPETAPQLDRMMDYYLPTTVKLLEAYRTLDEAAVETTSVANSKREIASTLDMLHEAFEKLLDTLFRDVAWDVSTDISVLRTMLAQDGLTKGAFEGDSSPEAR